MTAFASPLQLEPRRTDPRGDQRLHRAKVRRSARYLISSWTDFAEVCRPELISISTKKDTYQ